LPILPSLSGADKTVLFHSPFGVVDLHERRYRLADFLDVAEDPAVDHLLFEGAVET